MVIMEEHPESGIVLRLAMAADADRVETLAQLDSARVAALSLADGGAVADPFRRTAGLVALLRMRADQLLGRGTPGGTTLSALERRTADLRSAKPFAALRRLA